VRRLGTDGVAENRGSAAATAHQRKAAVGARIKCTGKVLFYSCVMRRSNTGLCKERGREVMARRGGRASVRSHGAERSEGNNGRREGHARGGNFVRTPASGW
jgi:hypothetical protein